jgi:hypothetical protein
MALVHVICVAFESWVLPARRLAPTLVFDLQVSAASYVWVTLLRVSKPAFIWVPGYWD